VVLPNIRPALAAVSILIFLQAWNEYFWPLPVTTKMEDTMIQVGLQLFLQADDGIMLARAVPARESFGSAFAATRGCAGGLPE
jgi:ABC-type glycerol-3-phosphate transport system permease component